jgi:broad specificity phosphatase PhoE
MSPNTTYAPSNITEREMMMGQDDVIKQSTSSLCSPLKNAQSVYVIRHGDRWDYEIPSWNTMKYSRKGDSPLSPRGQQQAYETGQYLKRIFSHNNVNGQDITWLSSPFLRCIQTSDMALLAMQSLPGISPRVPSIKIENSIWEWDGKGGEWHASLPTDMKERSHYFPRIDVTHESLFTPALPEPRSEFHQRCQQMWISFEQQYQYRCGSVIVLVTHAASCIGIVSAATKLPFSDITPAGPCSIYHLSRAGSNDQWHLDPHDGPHSMNGYTDHLSDVSGKTVPWNNFGDKVHVPYYGYTGPPTSRFAPPKLREIALNESNNSTQT